MSELESRPGFLVMQKQMPYILLMPLLPVMGRVNDILMSSPPHLSVSNSGIAVMAFVDVQL